MRWAKTVAEREAHRCDGAWRPHLARCFRHERNEDGRQPEHLDLALYRDYRPVAERAPSGEQHRVRARALDRPGHFRRATFVEIAQKLGISHESQVLVADARDDAFGGQLAQTIYREDAVDVAIGMAMVVVAVRHHEAVALHVARNKPPGVIARQD